MPMTVFKTFSDGVRCVEPVKRMVGGRFGWAMHRFPIKGGLTTGETLAKDWAKALHAECMKRSYFFGLVGPGNNAPIQTTKD